jgi:hypothetical protein
VGDETPERDTERRRKAIEEELHRLEESAMYSAQVQFEAAKQWRGLNLALGVPASVLAAVSGATALTATTGRIIAGVLALVSAGFGAILTTRSRTARLDLDGIDPGRGQDGARRWWCTDRRDRG